MIKENLGYDIGCEHQFIGGRNGLYVTVVSPSYDPTYLLTRINEFTKSLSEVIGKVF